MRREQCFPIPVMSIAVLATAANVAEGDAELMEREVAHSHSSDAGL
jgi:hypothetical protein